MMDRQNKWRRRVGLATVGLAAVGVGCGCAAAAYMKHFVDFAMDREPPQFKNAEKLKGRKKNGEQGPIPEDFPELVLDSCEPVSIQSDDGERLVGYWCEAPDAKRTVIAFHGWRSSWKKDFRGIGDFLKTEQCNVLYVEQRAQNGSGGSYIGFGLLERCDCALWAKWISREKSADLPIYLMGVSMGAATVLMAAGLELPAGIHGIVADCGFTSPDAIWRHVVVDNLGLPGFPGGVADHFCQRKIHMSMKAYSTVAAMKANHIPVLFIHGTDDHFVPIEMTYEAYRACGAEKRLLVVPGAEHAQSYRVDRARYQETLREFWSDFDQR